MMRTQISLTAEDRRLLDDVAARTGRSISSLIRDAVVYTYGFERDVDSDLRAIDSAMGVWNERETDGADYVESLRTGSRWQPAAS